jgi:hypothetical protein
MPLPRHGYVIAEAVSGCDSEPWITGVTCYLSSSGEREGFMS